VILRIRGERTEKDQQIDDEVECLTFDLAAAGSKRTPGPQHAREDGGRAADANEFRPFHQACVSSRTP
jgi:hypothetical protein